MSALVSQNMNFLDNTKKISLYEHIRFTLLPIMLD